MPAVVVWHIGVLIGRRAGAPSRGALISFEVLDHLDCVIRLGAIVGGWVGRQGERPPLDPSCGRADKGAWSRSNPSRLMRS
jgi:hypothetical protein